MWTPPRQTRRTIQQARDDGPGDQQTPDDEAPPDPEPVTSADLRVVWLRRRAGTAEIGPHAEAHLRRLLGLDE